MSDVYICGARSDQRRIEPLLRVLEARGFGVTAGDDPATASASRAVLVVWTPASVGDKRIVAVAAAAGDRLVPVVLDPVQPPEGFQSQNTELLTLWPGPAGEGAFERLVLRLEGLTARKAQPASVVSPALLKSARQSAAAAAGRRSWGGRIRGLLGLAAVGVVGYGIATNWPAIQGSVTPGAQKATCGAVEQYCLTADELRVAQEGKLLDLVQERAAPGALDGGVAAKDPLSLGLACLQLAYRSENVGEARTQCTAASQAGSPLGGLGLAKTLAGSEPDAAKQLLGKAAADGDARAQYQLALMEHSADNFAGALRQIDDCGPAGYLPCQYMKAYMLENGQGVPKNAAEAVRIYTDLADPQKAFPQAASSLAFLYETGADGVAIDLPQAALLYQRAAEFGDAYALFRLGVMAENGLLPGKGRAEAFAYYRQAAEAGDEDAAAALARLGAP